MIILCILEGKYYLTKGFLPLKIDYTAPFNPHFVIHKDSSECSDAFNQDYFYLGKGRQCYVFESQDKKYVIKFIRYHKYRACFFWTVLDYLKLLTTSQKKTLIEKEQRYLKAMNSYYISFKELKNITQVEYIHLNRSDDIKKELTLHVNFNKYSINLDNTAFVIQKKATQLSDYLTQNISDKKQGFKIVDSFWDALVFKTNMKIINTDSLNIIRNSGVLNEHFIEMDIGSFIKTYDQQRFKILFKNYVDGIRSYLQNLDEEYLTHFDKRYAHEIDRLNI